jgi:hypothetical protein
VSISPTDQQKAELLKYLDTMPSDQWTAMIRWFGEKLVSDQKLLLIAVSRETVRRIEKMKGNDRDGNPPALECVLSSVLNDCGLCLAEVRR